MTATITLWHKHMTKFFRSPEAAFGMLMQPVLWVVLFGVGMQAMLGNDAGSLLPATMPGRYVDFMIPGIIILSALSGAVSGGATLLDERLRGIIKEYLAAPVPRYSILLANALSTITKGLFQAVVIMILAVPFGALPSPNPLRWLAGLAMIGFYGLGIAGLALIVAARVNTTMGYHGLIALDLPLFFASSALYPLDVLPGWMQIIARLNPTTHAIDSIRQLTYGISYPGQSDLLVSGGVVIVFGMVGIGLASLAFRREIKRRGGAG